MCVCVCVAVIITMMGTLRWLNQHFFCSDNGMYDCVMFDCKRLVFFFFLPLFFFFFFLAAHHLCICLCRLE